MPNIPVCTNQDIMNWQPAQLIQRVPQTALASTSSTNVTVPYQRIVSVHNTALRPDSLPAQVQLSRSTFSPQALLMPAQISLSPRHISSATKGGLDTPFNLRPPVMPHLPDNNTSLPQDFLRRVEEKLSVHDAPNKFIKRHFAPLQPQTLFFFPSGAKRPAVATSVTPAPSSLPVATAATSSAVFSDNNLDAIGKIFKLTEEGIETYNNYHGAAKIFIENKLIGLPCEQIQKRLNNHQVITDFELEEALNLITFVNNQFHDFYQRITPYLAGSPQEEQTSVKRLKKSKSSQTQLPASKVSNNSMMQQFNRMYLEAAPTYHLIKESVAAQLNAIAADNGEPQALSAANPQLTKRELERFNIILDKMVTGPLIFGNTRPASDINTADRLYGNQGLSFEFFVRLVKSDLSNQHLEFVAGYLDHQLSDISATRQVDFSEIGGLSKKALKLLSEPRPDIPGSRGYELLNAIKTVVSKTTATINGSGLREFFQLVRDATSIKYSDDEIVKRLFSVNNKSEQSFITLAQRVNHASYPEVKIKDIIKELYMQPNRREEKINQLPRSTILSSVASQYEIKIIDKIFHYSVNGELLSGNNIQGDRVSLQGNTIVGDAGFKREFNDHHSLLTGLVEYLEDKSKRPTNREAIAKIVRGFERNIIKELRKPSAASTSKFPA